MFLKIEQGEGKSTIELTAREESQSGKETAANERAVPENHDDDEHYLIS